jgi:hypothetical protein
MAFLLIFLAILLVAVISGSVIAGLRLARRSSGMGRGAAVLLILVCGAGFVLRMWGVPHTQRVVRDEFQYLSVAQNIFYHGQATIILRGDKYHPEETVRQTRLPGQAMLLAATYAVTGESPRNAFVLNLILGVLSIGLIYRIGWLMFQDHMAAIGAAAALAFLPLPISYSACASADVPAFFFFLLALMFGLEWWRSRDKVVLYTAIGAACYAVYVKPEYFLLLAGGVAVLFRVMRSHGRMDRRVYSDIMFSTLCLLAPVLLSMPLVIRGENHNGGGLLFSFHYVLDHWRGNLKFLGGRGGGSVVLTLLFLVGSIQALRRRDRPFMAWALGWFILGFVIISGYFAGSLMEKSHARYFFLVLVPYLLLSAGGISLVLSKVKKIGPILVLVLLGILGVDTVQALGMENFFLKCSPGAIRTMEREIQCANTDIVEHKAFLRVDGVLLRHAAERIPADAYIVHAVPEFVTVVSDKKVIPFSEFLAGDRPRRIVYLEGEAMVPHDQYACRDILRSPVGIDGATRAVRLCEKAR